MALATAVAAMVVAYQREVGNSLIWLGETLSGKTKASGGIPENKPSPVNTAPDATSAASAAPAENSVDSQKPDEHKSEPTNTTPKSAADGSPASAAGAASSAAAVGRQGSRLDAANQAGGGERQESSLDRQQIPRSSRGIASPAINPGSWSANESVESLWGAVQGGSVAAERSLAERFVHGEGVTKNCDQAKILLKAAADRGSREARLRLYELETGGCQ
jgi:TPR repeat protein